MSIMAQAQKLLQVEKSGTLRTHKLYIGDPITFTLKNDQSGWYHRYIDDINIERGTLLFKNTSIHIDSIAAIKLPREGKAGKIFGSALVVGGANVMLFNGYYAVFQDQSLDWTAMAAGAANMIIGYGLMQISKTKVFKVGKRKRLRVLDLTFWSEADTQWPPGSRPDPGQQ